MWWFLIQPNVPYGLLPSASTAFDATVAKQFSWTYSNPVPADLQFAYYIEYKINTIGSTVATIEVTSANAYHDFSAGTFVNGTEYVWRVKTKDTTDSLYSM